MADRSLHLLADQLRRSQAPALWIADESNGPALDSLSQHPGPLQLISNRFDIARQAGERGLRVSFSDFDLSQLEICAARVFYRVSKEKPVVNHVLNSAYQTLPVGGELWLSGQKNEGIKTAFAQANRLFGCRNSLKKVGNDYIGRVEKTASDNNLLDDQRYSELRWIESPGDEGFFSKPGAYGWNKIDKGSAFLAAHLDKILESVNPAATRFLDLGCGYGYLMIKTRHCHFASITGTDNNAAAVGSAAANMKHYGIDACITADDCGSALTGRFDLILCNPPFHQGFSVESSLTDRFLDAVGRLLAAGGRACLVVNAFIPLEAKAARQLASQRFTVEPLANNGQFKVVQITAS